MAITASPQQFSNSGIETVGTIKGVVWTGGDDLPGRWSVVIERGETHQDIVTNENGRFETKLLPGAYFAWVRPTTTKAIDRVRRIPFSIQAGRVTEIELDPTSEYVYCSSIGERVIPIQTSNEGDSHLKGLHRPKVETFVLKPSEKESMKVTIEYCGRTQSSKSIRYKSAIVTYNAFSILAPEVEFDFQKYTLEGWGKIYVVQDGKRSETPHLKADFKGGNVISLSTENSRVRKPQ